MFRSSWSVGLAALVVVVPGSAHAGTVVRDAGAVTYQAVDGVGSGESVAIGGDATASFVTSERGATSSTCTQTEPTRADCGPTPSFVVRLLGLDDGLSSDAVAGLATLEAFGGGGADTLAATPNADRLFGEDGFDTLDGRGGNDLLDGGPGDDSLADGPGDDTVVGGPGNDAWRPGPGRDTFVGGVGGDLADYSERTAPLTITLDGRPDDGEAGEGDDVAADVEVVFGGSSDDRIVAGPVTTELRGGGGNDTMTTNPGGTRIVGEEGDDTIDSRNGVYDSVDCGPGNDVVLADPGDDATGCEVAPDRDGDRTLNEADCAPDDPAVHPGAGEVFSNAIDEDCKDGPGYFQTEALIALKILPRKRVPAMRFLGIKLTALRSGDRIELRCRGRGCPITVSRLTATSGRSLDLASRLKKRYVRVGAVVEIRVSRANRLGKVLRLTVVKGPNIRQDRLCVPVGGSTPQACPVT